MVRSRSQRQELHRRPTASRTRPAWRDPITSEPLLADGKPIVVPLKKLDDIGPVGPERRTIADAIVVARALVARFRAAFVRRAAEPGAMPETRN